MTTIPPAYSGDDAEGLRDFLRRLAKATIRYKRFKEICAVIQTSLELTAESGDPHCMSLDGLPGAGKTTIAVTFWSAFPVLRTETETLIPILYVLTPSSPSIKGLCSKILEVLGDPLAMSGTQWAMESRLYYYLRKCKVRLIIFDEFHGLYDAETDKILLKVSDWLKVFIKEAKIPVLVIGRQGKVNSILNANPELSRLFPARERLDPLTWDTSNLQDPYGMWRFMQIAEKAIEVPLPQNIGRLELLYRLHYATDGLVGHLMKLLRNAASTARKQKKTEIDLRLLSKAFREELAAHFPNKINPFDAPADKDFVPQPTSPVVSTPKGKAKRSSGSTKLGGVLTTK